MARRKKSRKRRKGRGGAPQGARGAGGKPSSRKVRAADPSGAGWADWLQEPVDASTVVAFRWLLGGIMLWEAVRWLVMGRLEGWFHPTYRLAYPGFEWVEALPVGGMWALFLLLALASIGLAAGIRPRPCAGVSAVVFGYVLMIDASSFQNHWYLYVLLLGMLAFTAPAAGETRIPRAVLLALKVQVGVVFLYAGLAKLEPDWLGGFTTGRFLVMRIGRNAYVEGLVSLFGGVDPTARFLAWAGAAFDLLVIPLLLWARTRPLAIAAGLFFHFSNSHVFEIGTFPHLGAGSMLLFLEPETPGRLWARLFPGSRGSGDGKGKVVPRVPGAVLLLLGIHLVVQVLLPLRHFRDHSRGPPEWTGYGKSFAWRMKMSSWTGAVFFRITDPTSGRRQLVPLKNLFTVRQATAIMADPQLLAQAARLVVEGLRRKGHADPRVHVVEKLSMNGRPYQQRVRSSLDLGNEPYVPGVPPWLLPPEPRPEGATPSKPGSGDGLKIGSSPALAPRYRVPGA